MDSEGTLRGVLDTALDASVRSVRHVPVGNHKRTYLVTLGDGREVVVQFRATAAGGLGAEPLLAREIAARTGVPVAPVVTAGTHDGVDYLVSERIRGEDLHERFTALAPDSQEQVVADLGRALGELHTTFRYEGYGRVVDDDGALRVTEPSTDWPAHFGDHVADALEDLVAPLDDLVGPVRAALAACEGLPAAPPAALFPWDLRPGNALVADDQLVALLDWGSPLAAHAEFSFAKAEYLTVDWYVDPDRAAVLREAFREGYTEMAALAPGWRERRRHYRLGAIVSSAVDSSGRITQPGYPPVDPDRAAAFHRRHVQRLL